MDAKKELSTIAQLELDEKLKEINLKLNEINEKSASISSINQESSPESVESYLADYRVKLDQLEQLIANLTSPTTPLHSSTPNINSESESHEPLVNSWKSLISLKLKRTKDLISKVGTFGKQPTTVTKYLPTSKKGISRIYVLIYIYLQLLQRQLSSLNLRHHMMIHILTWNMNETILFLKLKKLNELSRTIKHMARIQFSSRIKINVSNMSRESRKNYVFD
jgi:hypothetical protein